jgi:hypothetical protein
MTGILTPAVPAGILGEGPPKMQPNSGSPAARRRPRTVTKPLRLSPSVPVHAPHTAAAWHAAGLGGWLTRGDGEHFWVGPAIVLGQDLAESAGRVGDGPVADLAARDRQKGNRHGEAAGL